VLSLIDRRAGRAKSFVVDDLKKETVLPILRANIAREAHVMTDEARVYDQLAADFAGHDFVSHAAGEYVRGEVHTQHP
jgi:transposase-like protein